MKNFFQGLLSHIGFWAVFLIIAFVLCSNCNPQAAYEVLDIIYRSKDHTIFFAWSAVAGVCSLAILIEVIFSCSSVLIKHLRHVLKLTSAAQEDPADE